MLTIQNFANHIVVGLDYTDGNLAKALDRAIVKFDGQTIGDVKVSADNKGILLASLANVDAIADAVAPSLLTAIRQSDDRQALYDAAIAAYNAYTAAVNALRDHDAKIVTPFGLNEIFHWTLDAADIAVRDRGADVDNNKKANASATVQEKPAGTGKGHRKTVWTRGVWTGKGRWGHFTLTLTDDSATIIDNVSGAIVYSAPVAWGKQAGAKSYPESYVTKHGVPMVRKMVNYAVSLGWPEFKADNANANYNVPGDIWGFPEIATANDQDE